MKKINLDVSFFGEMLIPEIDKKWPLQGHHYVTIDHKDFKGKVLDVGAGCSEFGIVAKLIKPDIDLYIMDTNPFFINMGFNLAKKAGVALKGYAFNVEEEPFEENTFDVVNMSHVLEHVEDAKKALLWAKKILKPTGTLFINIPFGSCFDSPEHLHYFADMDGFVANSKFHGSQTCTNIKTLARDCWFAGKIMVFHPHQLDKRHCFPPTKQTGIMLVLKAI